MTTGTAGKRQTHDDAPAGPEAADPLGGGDVLVDLTFQGSAPPSASNLIL